MPIKSYLVFPESGKKDVLQQELEQFPQCEVYPSTNEDLLVLVTDTTAKEEENQLLESINGLNFLKHLSMVSGFEDQVTTKSDQQ